MNPIQSPGTDSGNGNLLQINEKRRENFRCQLYLRELDPRDAVEGVCFEGSYIAEDFVPAGDMRELCPNCADTPLKLVLPFRHVKRAHLVCPNCTSCFEAFYADGRNALEFEFFNFP